MNRILKMAGMAVGALLLAGVAANAQQPAAAPLTVEYYYKLAPGTAKEWLALYKKNHNPILREHMKSGLLLSEKLYERRYHSLTPAWGARNRGVSPLRRRVATSVGRSGTMAPS